VQAEVRGGSPGGRSETTGGNTNTVAFVADGTAFLPEEMA